MKKYTSILIILLLSLGFIVSLNSALAAMGNMAGSDNCVEHCLFQATVFSNQQIIVVQAFWLLLLAITFSIGIYSLQLISFYYFGRQSNLFSPYYLFKTVILRE